MNILDLEFRLEIAVRKMLANAIEYGCQVTEDQITVQFDIAKNKIALIVGDPGEGFDWENHNFKIEPVLDERGRGLKMINEVSDKIEFNNKDNLIKITFLGGK
ncbi:MAG: ATP-binding protein [Bacillota bacterium]